MMDLSKLSAEFPREDVHWRAQTLTKDGTKALALAYLDARDVMDRLDDVCGPENWQSHFDETAKGRVICRLSIRVDSEWVTKSDGAGDTAVEGEKGGISDALKRAAVSWGVGRYLYRLPSVWVPCECSEFNGKKQWKRWSADPWQFVKAPPRAKPEPTASGREVDAAIQQIGALPDMDALKTWWSALVKNARHVAEDADVIAAKDARKDALSQKEAA